MKTLAKHCFYCNTEMVEWDFTKKGRIPGNACTIDHVFPRSRTRLGAQSGTWNSFNRVRACRTCNNKKNDMLPLDWLKVMPKAGVNRTIRRLMRLGVAPKLIAEAWAERPGVPAATKPDTLLSLIVKHPVRLIEEAPAVILTEGG